MPSSGVVTMVVLGWALLVGLAGSAAERETATVEAAQQLVRRLLPPASAAQIELGLLPASNASTYEDCWEWREQRCCYLSFGYQLDEDQRGRLLPRGEQICSPPSKFLRYLNDMNGLNDTLQDSGQI